MSLRALFFLFVPGIVGAWWLLHEDPEQEVRNAHQELVRLVGKSEGDGDGDSLSILEVRALQSLFADPVRVAGDAETRVGTYSPEEMVRTVIGVQAQFDDLRLTFGELTIEFTGSDEAVVGFSAMLEGRRVIEGEADIAETRDVTSRMQAVDGTWLFTGFELSSN